jgi:hypothetical protein
VAEFEMLSQHLLEGTEKCHENYSEDDRNLNSDPLKHRERWLTTPLLLRILNDPRAISQFLVAKDVDLYASL